MAGAGTGAVRSLARGPRWCHPAVAPEDLADVMRDFAHIQMDTEVSVIGKVGPKSDRLIVLR